MNNKLLPSIVLIILVLSLAGCAMPSDAAEATPGDFEIDEFVRYYGQSEILDYLYDEYPEEFERYTENTSPDFSDSDTGIYFDSYEELDAYIHTYLYDHINPDELVTDYLKPSFSLKEITDWYRE